MTSLQVQRLFAKSQLCHFDGWAGSVKCMFFRYNTCLVLSVCKALVVESESTLEEVFNMTFWAQAKRLVKPRYSRYLSHGRCDL